MPSNIDNKCSVGTNRLIQQGAKLIIKPREIITIIQNKGNNLINKNDIEKIKNKKEEDIKNLRNKTKELIKSKDKRKVPEEYEKIYKLLTYEPIHINDICKMYKKNIQEVTRRINDVRVRRIYRTNTSKYV